MDFEELYRTYFSDVYQYIRKLSGSEHMAEEITEETFYKALRKIESFRGDCDIRVWLCQIAKNSYYSHLRKSGQHISIEDAALQDTADPEGAVDERLSTHDEADQIRVLLHTLSDPYKEVFMWRVFAELSFKEIGRLYGKSDNWACVTYHRARNMLRERLEENKHEK